jgi:hypothetical protein
MQTISLKAHTNNEGILHLEIPTHLLNKEIEVVVVLQALETEPLDEMGYPIGYFEETYGSFADEPMERNQPPYPDVREELE